MRKPFLAGLAISRSLKPTKVAMATIPMVSAAWAQAEEIAALGLLNETKPAEARIVSTEFGYAPAKVSPYGRTSVPYGRASAAAGGTKI